MIAHENRLQSNICFSLVGNASAIHGKAPFIRRLSYFRKEEEKLCIKLFCTMQPLAEVNPTACSFPLPQTYGLSELTG